MLLPTGPLVAIQALAASIVLDTQLGSLPIMTLSMADTSELNIVVVLSLPTLPSHEIAWSFVYVTPPTVMDETGHASGWFFQYPGVPVPGLRTDLVTNPKSVSGLSAPTTCTSCATLLPSPSDVPSLSNVKSVPL